MPLDKQVEIIYVEYVKAFLNASEAARILQVDRATITRWIKKGVIHGARRPELLKVNSFCRCCGLLLPIPLPQKKSLKPSDPPQSLGDDDGSPLSPDNSLHPSCRE